MQNNFIIDFDFVPLSFEKDCMPYFSVVDSQSNEANFYRSLMYQDLNNLVAIKNSFERKHRCLPEKLFSLPKPKLINVNEILYFCYRKMERLEKKFQSYTLLYYKNAVEVTQKMIEYHQNATKNNLIVTCRVKDYKSFIFNGFTHSNTLNIKELLIKIQRLDAYSLKLSDSYSSNKFVPISEKNFRNSLKHASTMLQNNYLPLGQLDDYFLRYTIVQNQLKLFDSAAKKVVDESKNKNGRIEYSLNGLDNKYLKFGEINLKEEAALRISIMRLFFDRLYLIFPQVLTEQSDFNVFIQHCKELRDLTPAQLQISKTMITSEMTNIPFSKIIEKTHYLIASVKSLQRVHFFSNTLDMCAVIFKCLRGIHHFVYQNQHKTNPKKSENDNIEMSFDDCFSIFIPLLAFDPPANCVAVSKFLFNVVKIKIPSHFEFAQLVFTSAVNFILDLKIQEFIKTNE